MDGKIPKNKDGNAVGKQLGSGYEMTDIRKITNHSINIHPEPAGEPVIGPAENFYDRISFTLDEDGQLPP